ncbi:lytic transglycosylase domain-containing protein (plasmid) [Gemmobacter fulvus]|uniref:Lytic transglycosylase domain-containing protein n=1 Tax=Gemmobacter fulvus TaxID=2840474 RepID=A0A975PAR3_9RHOB|nr:lytic transglycosylase domain-containing protein [Gemmobacter fulvus]MBT9247708.1 lytic transglycosylase domain-containing protein [Gemmobacter fulvus]QWK92890.1 lytic transglycosylase domain-containing protein [Gemmobacter fulvus]
MSFPATKFQRSARVLALATAALPLMAMARGVPIADGKSVIQHALEIAQMTTLTGARELEADKKSRSAELHQNQLDALDATLAMMTGPTRWITDLEILPGAETAALYKVEDNSPYAARLFGDAKTSIEEMIVATARKYATHPGLARAGLNPVEFRIWFQSLVKQESGFSIGARSPVGAFGLTQVMPGTARDLGIYPAYYDDPMLQLDGGARYFLAQLNKFGSVPLALAAYNAGPGNVSKYGGIPPFKETQDYVVRITGFFNAYAHKITGVDQVGTFDPRDLAIAEASNIADAGLHYGMAASVEIEAALKRLRSIIERIPTTKSAKEAFDLNSYARAEAVRIALMVGRVKSARTKVDQARYALWLQAYAVDSTFLKVSAGSK